MTSYQDKSTRWFIISWFVCLIVYLFGPAREAFERGVQLARGFPPSASGRRGRFFTQLLFHNPMFRLADYFFSLIHVVFN